MMFQYLTTMCKDQARELRVFGYNFYIVKYSKSSLYSTCLLAISNYLKLYLNEI